MLLNMFEDFSYLLIDPFLKDIYLLGDFDCNIKSKSILLCMKDITNICMMIHVEDAEMIKKYNTL